MVELSKEAREAKLLYFFFNLLYMTIEAFVLIGGAEVSEYPASSRKLLVIQVKQHEASCSFWSGMISVVDGGFTHLWHDCHAPAYLWF